jgi:hypothetical protein
MLSIATARVIRGVTHHVTIAYAAAMVDYAWIELSNFISRLRPR